MGYTTDFEGKLTFDKPLTAEQVKYINTFCSTRRMKRDVNILNKLYNGEHGFNGDYGIEGAYFAKDDGQMGQSRDASIIEYNDAPGTPPIGLDNFGRDYDLQQKMIEAGECQPGLWCQWGVSEDGATLEWNGSEKFYNYVEWLKYLIAHFFNIHGSKLNGEIEWKGEDPNDMGKIIAVDSIISTKIAKIIYE